MSTAQDVAEVLGQLAKDLTPFLPDPLQAPAKIVQLVLQDVNGFRRTISVDQIAARETAAGASVNRAAHLAGLREAIFHVLAGWRNVGLTDSNVHEATAEVMAEVLKRLPQ